MLKTDKLTSLIKLVNDGLTREEFVAAFGNIIKLITNAEAQHNKNLDAAIDHMVDVVKQKLATVRDGKDSTVPGPQGDQGPKGEPGKDGESVVGPSGKDGSPDTPVQVRDKLETIKDGEKLSIQAIQDLVEKLEELEKKQVGGIGKKGQAYGSIRTRYIDDETPSGTIDGSNTSFTISKAPNPVNSLKVYVGGIRLRVTEDYTFSGRTITFTTAPLTNSIILVDFRY